MGPTSIAITSPSVAVVKNISAIVERAGWTLVEKVEATVLLVHTPKKIQLQCGGVLSDLECPISPLALLAALANITVSIRLPFANGWTFDCALRALVYEETLQGQLLTEKEALLLEALYQGAPLAVSRDALLREVWLYEADVETHTLETHIYRLRQKLEMLHPRPCDIETIEGAYRLLIHVSSKDNK